MINLSLNKQLDIIMPSTNRALAVALEQATPKELDTILKDKDLKSIMDSLLKGSAKNSASDKTLLELVKNNPTLKDLGNVSSTIKELLNTLKADKNPLPIETTLKKFLIDIKELNEPILKQKFENSGIFLESKLKNVQNPQLELKNLLQSLEKSIAKIDTPNAKLLNQNIKELLANPILRDASNATLLQPPKDDLAALKELAKGVEKVLSKVEVVFLKEASTIVAKLAPFKNPQRLAVQESVKEILSEDLKAVLLKAGDEISKSSHPNQSELLKHVDKLLLQIDYYQLLSHLSNSSSLYLPFSWEQLEEGNINIKKDKEDKFYCDIDLKLKEYGELKLKLALYEENQINIHIYSDSAEFKEIVKENIGLLRSSLIESNITPREIRIFDAVKKNSPYESSDNRINIGFEVKV